VSTVAAYRRPDTVAEAIELLAKDESSLILAGGTDLLLQLHRGSNAIRLVDVSRLQKLRGVTLSGGNISVGATETFGAIADHPILREHAPILCDAASSVGSAQIRNTATIGGNVCNASPCADSVPALVALEAEVELASRKGMRRVAVQDFLSDAYSTIREPDEIAVRFLFPTPPRDAGSAFVKLGRRKALSIARMHVAVVARVVDSEITECRVVIGSVFPTTRRVWKVEQLLIGRTPSDKLCVESGHEVALEMIQTVGVRWSTPYKQPVVATLTARALRNALGIKHDE
jgi:CO/xanthine dehydrogenase FAD-binding subunit